MLILNIMKILSLALAGLLIGSVCSVSAVDLDKLTTSYGKTYRNVEILDADQYGLMFRHRDGIAKESFGFLSKNIQATFAPAVEPPNKKGGKGKKAQQAAPVGQPWEITLTWRMRQPIVQQCPLHSLPAYPYHHPAYFHPYHPNPWTWPSHWHRFHPAHYLTNPHYRALATRNFLHHTGLLGPYRYRW